MARPTKLDDDAARALLAATRAGFPIRQAAAHAGVGERTVYRWLEHGRRRGARWARHRALRAALERARGEAELDLIARMTRAAQRGSWRAAAWLLERADPERWGPPEHRRQENASDSIDWRL